MKRVAVAILSGVLLLAAAAWPRAAGAANDRELDVEVGSGKVIHTGRPIANLFAADPKIAEVRPSSPTAVFVFGVTVGRTTLAAFDEAGDMIVQYDVVVGPSQFASGEANKQSAEELPSGAKVTFEPTVKGVRMSGKVATPAEAEQAAAIADSMMTKGQAVDNRLSIDLPVQVNLRVRIAEIDRDVTRELGINWSALGSIGKIGLTGVLSANLPASSGNALELTSINGHSADAILDLLAQDNLATILAEPNLTARSGETASFLAGGEFPVPIAASSTTNTITVEFKSYGISLAFVPTVLSADRISMRVRPEVSQLTDNGSVSVPIGTNSTVTIPGLTVRRAETTIELGSGQTFAIAGLISRTTTGQMSGLPYLGDLPVLGPLFKSDSFVRDESELVILVTPYLVRPVSPAGGLRSPLDGVALPDDVDRVLLSRQRARGNEPDSDGRQMGDVGFLLN
jgi:pilus assembly protein CpaC